MKPGDVVLVRFPNHDGSWKYRPALVLETEEALSREPYLCVAYGTSQKTGKNQLLSGEFLVSMEAGSTVFAVSGLREATKFSLGLRVHVLEKKARLIGCIHLNLMRAFMEAAKDVGLV